MGELGFQMVQNDLAGAATFLLPFDVQVELVCQCVQLCRVHLVDRVERQAVDLRVIDADQAKDLVLLADAVDLLDQELPVCDGQRDHVDTIQIQMLFQILFGDNGTALPAGTAGDDHPAGSTAVEQALAQGRHVLERIGQCLPQRGQAADVRGKAGGFNGHQRDGYLNGVDHDAAFLLDHLKHLLEAAHVINGKNAALAVTLQNAVFQLAVNQLQVLVQVHVVGGDLASADGPDHGCNAAGHPAPMHGDQDSRTAGVVRLLPILTQEQRHECGFLRTEGDVEFFFHIRDQLGGKGIFVFMGVDDLQQLIAGQSALHAVGVLQNIAQVQAQAIEGRRRIQP